jgi:TolA-binding protein
LSQGVRVVPTYVRAGAIAQDVLQRNPDHPGAAHYVIHAFDDPVHAPLGLHAARAYSKIAPAAPHAQHMTTHIFLAMGMWDDVVSQNEIAAGHDHDRYRAGHYTAWLGYGYLQQGRYADARRHFETMRRNAGTPPRRGEEASLLAMRAHYLVNSERWSDSLAHWAPKAPVGPVVAAMDAFATAYAALKSGRRAQAEAGLRDLVRRGQATSVGDFFGGDSLVPVILERQLRGLLRLQDGEVDAGLALLRQAAAMEDGLAVEFGPPNVVKPSRETLGEALLALGRAAAAAREFERALQLAPGRARALLGLARSATAAGDHSLARRTAEALAAKWHAADSTLPELAEVGRLARGR